MLPICIFASVIFFPVQELAVHSIPIKLHNYAWDSYCAADVKNNLVHCFVI